MRLSSSSRTRSKHAQIAEEALLRCQFDHAIALIEDQIARLETRMPLRNRTRRALAGFYCDLAVSSLCARDFDAALVHAQRSYDLVESAGGASTALAIRPLVMRSELSWVRGAMAESKSTAEQAWAIALQQRTEPDLAAPALLRGATLAEQASKLPEARAAASEAARLASSSSGVGASVYLGAHALLARINWRVGNREIAIKCLSELRSSRSLPYFQHSTVALAEMAFSRNQIGAAAALLWTPAALDLATRSSPGQHISQLIEYAMSQEAEVASEIEELKTLLAYAGRG